MNEKKIIECMALMKDYCSNMISCNGCPMKDNCRTWDCIHPSGWNIPKESDYVQ